MTQTAPAPRLLLEGSEALAEAMIAAGCRFFAGYPMTPFTEVLEHFARLLPDVDGVCINAESELEAVGRRTRPRAAPVNLASVPHPLQSRKRVDGGAVHPRRGIASTPW